MPNSLLTIDNITREVWDYLGGTQVAVELNDSAITVAIRDAVREYNRCRPLLKVASLAVTSGQRKYLINQVGLLGVTRVDFVGPGTQLGISSDFGYPFSSLSPTGLQVGGGTFGEIQAALTYNKQAMEIANSSPEWDAGFEGDNYYLYITVPYVGNVCCSYWFTCAMTPDDSPTTGINQIPQGDENWMMDYIRARCSYMLGLNRRKFGGIPGSDGQIEYLDGKELVQEAREELQRLTNQLEARRRVLSPVTG